MIGYHYTTYKNWIKIKEEGLKPYIDENGNLPKCRFIIWIWPNKLSFASHINFLVYLFDKRKETKIVLLSVDYEDSDIFRQRNLITKKKEIYSPNHQFGLCENFFNSEKSLCLCHPVPTSKVKLLKIYNLKNLK